MFEVAPKGLVLPNPLSDAWDRAREVGERLESLLADGLPDDVVCVAAVGSLGRMELTPSSDLDLVVVLRDEAPEDRAAEAAAYEAVWERAESLGYARPKTAGVFAEPTRTTALCATGTRGQVDESPVIFGKRIQLLLEGRPVFESEQFEQILRSVLNWYGLSESHPEPFRPWSFLLHDLERYRHSLAVRYQWLHRESRVTWRLLNLKAMFSRRLNLAGLRMLLGEFSTLRSATDGPEPFEWLCDRLGRTPLERLATCDEPTTVARLAELHGAFLEATSDPTKRAGLGDEECASYARLVEAGIAFGAELAALLSRRSARWARRFRDDAWT